MHDPKTLDDVCLSLTHIEIAIDRLTRTLLSERPVSTMHGDTRPAPAPRRPDCEVALRARLSELEQENLHLRNLVTNLSLETLMKF